MRTFDGVYSHTVTENVIFTVYKDDNGIWLKVTAKRDKLIWSEILAELDNDQAHGMGMELVRLTMIDHTKESS